MKTAFLHFRVYETDGVSLEMDKWRIAFSRMGHDTLYISGTLPKEGDIYIEELDYLAEYNAKIHRNAFESLVDFDRKEDLLDFINHYADQIYETLVQIIAEQKIDLLVPNNVSSLGFNLPVGIAVSRLAKNNIVPMLYHHHDFYWERERYQSPLFPEVSSILEQHFPNREHGTHCVINHLARQELYMRKQITAQVVPNVFDFEQALWKSDSYTKQLEDKLNIQPGDIVFLQATRIVERKAIELAYRIVKSVVNQASQYYGKQLYNGHEFHKESTIHFVLAGLNELPKQAFDRLDRLLQSGPVQIHYINDIVGHTRNSKTIPHMHSLWDTYTIADWITYTSILEGWGNQLLEGLFSKKPLLVYEYPVYKSDIKHFGFDLVTIDSPLQRDSSTLLYSIPNDLTRQKASQILEILFDHNQYHEVVENNFNLGAKHLSYNSLFELLSTIINTFID